MYIRHISIRHFRGIKALDWTVDGPTNCLIGPGDSTKTTILDAIDFALAPRWDLPLSDTDFYDSNVQKPIEITVTVGDLPDKLTALDEFGRRLRGWDPVNGLVDEPEGDADPVLSIRLSVDSSLEPLWTSYRDQDAEGRRVTYKHRELLGVVRLGAYVDRHLSWGRGSALTRFTGNVEDIPAILSEANRVARNSVSEQRVGSLKQAASRAAVTASSLGLKLPGELHPAIDTTLTTTGGTLALYAGQVPARMLGLGSRRLLVLALQRAGSQPQSVITVDEIEQGLEPHRLRHLLRTLRPANADGHNGQLFMTTHSPVVVEELNASEIVVVRSQDGTTNVSKVEPDLQDVLRAAPEALLGQRIIICEGRTELGVCRAMDNYWGQGPDGLPLACFGTVLTDGGGTSAPLRALKLARLGYQVAFLGDSDVPINPKPDALQTAGVVVVMWSDGLSIEQRVFRDLPWSAVQTLVDFAASQRGETSVRDSILSRLRSRGATPGDLDLDAWISNGIADDELRLAIGSAAKSANGQWFKTIDAGEFLGSTIASVLPQIRQTDLALKLETLKGWACAK